MLKFTMNGYPVYFIRHRNPGEHYGLVLTSHKMYLNDTKLHLDVRDGEKKDPIPFHGWVEITLNLLGNEDPRLAIHVPVLVSRIGLERPIPGCNVVQEIIRSGKSQTQALFTQVKLLSTAMETEGDKANAFDNLIQYKKT